MMVTKVNKGLGGGGVEKILILILKNPFYYPKWGISDKEGQSICQTSC